MLNIGGIPRGKTIELHGESGAGKSTISSLLCAQAQRQYPELMVLYLDQEMALNLEYLQELGVDISEDKFMLVQADDGIAALDTALTMMQTNQFSLIVIDSVPALITKQEFEGSVGDQHMAPLARLMSQTLKPLNLSAKETNTTLLFINQIRSNIGFGADSVCPGGKALPFFASIRLQLKRVGLITKGDNNIGQTVRINAVKTRFGFPYSKTDINIYFGKGINKNEEILEVAIDKGIITRGGAYYTFPINSTETNRIMGKDNVGLYLDQNPEANKYLESLIVESFNKKKESIVEIIEESEIDLEIDD